MRVSRRAALAAGSLMLWLGAGTVLSLGAPSRVGAENSRLEMLRARAEAEAEREAEWRLRYQEKRKAIDDAQLRISAAENGAGWSNRGATRQEIDEASTDLKRAKKELNEFYDEARRNDVPPGWLRN